MFIICSFLGSGSAKRISPQEHIRTGRFYGWDKRRLYEENFIPEGPILVHHPLPLNWFPASPAAPHHQKISRRRG